jgi:hypothetical protein
MTRRKHHLVQLEIPNTNRGGGWILAPKFEMMILETRRKLRKARLPQEELNRENKQLSRRLKRQKYQCRDAVAVEVSQGKAKSPRSVFP